MTCGTNLSGIGKAMLIYANDYDDEFPRAGGPSSRWTGRIPDWKAPDRYSAYGVAFDGSGGEVSMSASLYLLVKYAEVTPKSFICGGTTKTREKGITKFTLGRYSMPKNAELIDLWDFGPDPTRHVSFAYHMVYGPHELSISCEPGMAVAADRNPWMDSPSAKAKDFSRFKPDMPPFGGSVEEVRYGNTVRHDQDGQNVLFVDTHVEFSKRPWCGVEDDNIYTSWDGADKVRGTPPKLGSTPAGPTDSLLVNDPIRP
jgi:prepilin-type processing-associated H-X9-DG protein